MTGFTNRLEIEARSKGTLKMLWSFTDWLVGKMKHMGFFFEEEADELIICIRYLFCSFADFRGNEFLDLYYILNRSRQV